MKLEFSQDITDPVIKWSRHYIHKLDDREGHTTEVIKELVSEFEVEETEFSNGVPQNYKTESSLMDNAYPSPNEFRNKRVSGSRLNKLVPESGSMKVIESIQVDGNSLLVDPVEVGVTLVEYINKNGELVASAISSDNNVYPSTTEIDVGESFYDRSYVIYRVSNKGDTSQDPNYRAHLLYGHYHHPQNNGLYYNSKADIVNATSLYNITNTYDIEVSGGNLVSSDLSRYYLGTKILLDLAAVLQVSSEDPRTDVEVLNISDYDIINQSVADELAELYVSEGESFDPPSKGFLFRYNTDILQTNNLTRFYYFKSSYLGASPETTLSSGDLYKPCAPDKMTIGGTDFDVNYIVGILRLSFPIDTEIPTANYVKISAAVSSDIPPDINDPSKRKFTRYGDLILSTLGSNNTFPKE